MSKEERSYSRVFKSSTMIGGAQGINMLIGMIRVKFIAILIGPIGLGLIATYQSIAQLMGTISGLGLQSSSVRDIAEAAGLNDEERIGKVVLSLRRMCLLTGIIGAGAMLILSSTVSRITFDSIEYAQNISWIGLTILFTNLKAGQMALIQGMRRIGDLAKLNIIGAVCGTFISVLLYYFLGKEGIIPAIVLFSLTEFSASWWFARKIKVSKVSMSWFESFHAAGGMIKLGLAFMWTGLLVSFVAYLTRILIAQEIDIISVGIFSAAFSLSGLIVNFILSAMGADYYPSLTAVNNDSHKMRILVNQQTEIGLLLAIPGLLATLALAPWIIELFYSTEFYQAADLLRWFAIGCIGRVISWPLGFIILAKGLSKIFVATETFINLTHIILIIIFLDAFGIEGVSIAFPILYSIHIVMMLVISRYLIGFKWSRGVLKIFFIFSPFLIIAFCSNYFLSETVSALTGIAISILSGFICLKELLYKLGTEHKIYRIMSSVPIVKIYFNKKQR